MPGAAYVPLPYWPPNTYGSSVTDPRWRNILVLAAEARLPVLRQRGQGLGWDPGVDRLVHVRVQEYCASRCRAAISRLRSRRRRSREDSKRQYAPSAAVFPGTAIIEPGRFNPSGTFIGSYFLETGILGLQMLGVQARVSDVFYGGVLVVAVTIATPCAKEQPDPLGPVCAQWRHCRYPAVCNGAIADNGLRCARSRASSGGPVHPLDRHDEPAVVDHGDAQRLTELAAPRAGGAGERASSSGSVDTVAALLTWTYEAPPPRDICPAYEAGPCAGRTLKIHQQNFRGEAERHRQPAQPRPLPSFTRRVNTSHSAAPNASLAPSGSLLSRTAMLGAVVATSMQLPPL